MDYKFLVIESPMAYHFIQESWKRPIAAQKVSLTVVLKGKIGSRGVEVALGLQHKSPTVSQWAIDMLFQSKEFRNGCILDGMDAGKDQGWPIVHTADNYRCQSILLLRNPSSHSS